MHEKAWGAIANFATAGFVAHSVLLAATRGDLLWLLILAGLGSLNSIVGYQCFVEYSRLIANEDTTVQRHGRD